MKLNQYIQKVLQESEPGQIDFEVNLWETGEVAPYETGNKIKFSVIKESVRE